MVLFDAANLQIPEPHFKLFVACNAARSKSFYPLKDKILNVFGRKDDYDLQHITKQCHTCGGSGWYYVNTRCNRCHNGVYEVYDVVLKRYILNESVFHSPIGRLDGNRLKIWDGYEFFDDEFYDGMYSKWRYEPFEGIIKNTISGLIKHVAVENLNVTWAEWYLLYHYDKERFRTETTKWLDRRHSREDFQIRNYLWLTTAHPLIAMAKYYKCENMLEFLNTNATITPLTN